MIRKLVPVLGFILITAIFSWQALLKGLVPIPADTIVGLYHPYRDQYSSQYPNGLPFKNFLITDPVRQQYPWRQLSIDGLKNLEIPTWNPYSFSGTPLLANFQSAVFYPLNVLFFLLPQQASWSILILLQPLLAGVFMFSYLRNLKQAELPSFLGGVIFAFGGFFTTWLEWGTVLHVALWLPLILLSLDKVLEHSSEKISKSKFKIIWSAILMFCLTASFFAGHLQTFFYVLVLVLFYLLSRWLQKGRKLKDLYIFIVLFLIFLVLTSVQWLPTLGFIQESARSIDQNYLNIEGWFLPWQHLTQLLVPDFFGNPTTLNYWGTWNYGELTAYAGIIPFVLALFALFYRRDRKTLFFGTVFFISLIFALPTFFAKLPYVLNLPFISTAQPTRLIFLIDFSLAVLACLGLDYLIRSKKLKEIILPIVFVGAFLVLFLLFTLLGEKINIDLANLAVTRRNIFLPLGIFIAGATLLLLLIKTSRKFTAPILFLLIIITVFDLLRFSWKFNTFSDKQYLYPQTQSLKYLEENTGNFRVATADPRIMAPNFFDIYSIQTVEGYDPLFSSRYAEFVSAINRGRPDIAPPFGFNRIVRVENFDSNLTDLLGVKYVLTLGELKNNKFIKVFEEGATNVYENKNVLPRTFFVQNVLPAADKKEAINAMFIESFNPQETAIVENISKRKVSLGNARIIKYSPEEIVIETSNKEEGFLVLTDSFYPSWRAMIDSQGTQIYRTDYNFRGVLVPPGSHKVIFKNNLL